MWPASCGYAVTVLALRIVGVCLLLLAGCSAPAPPPGPTADPFQVVAARSAQRVATAQALAEQGQNEDALKAYRDARLLNPGADPSIDQAIATLEAAVQPTPIAPAEEPAPVPVPRPTAPTPAAAPTSAEVAGAPLSTATPAAVPVQPVATPMATPALMASSLFVPGEPVAIDAVPGRGDVFVADRSGLIWRLIGGQPTLDRPIALSGVPTGLGADESRLYVGLRANALAIVSIESGTVAATVQLPSAPGDVQVDPAIRRAFVLLPDQQALATVDLGTLDAVALATDLPPVTGMAVDREGHHVLLSHADGRISVLDGTTGAVSSRLSTSEALSGVAAVRGLAYAVNAAARQLFVVDPATSGIRRLALADEPRAIAAGGRVGGLYALFGDAIAHLDPATGREIDRIPLHDAVQPPARLLVSPTDDSLFALSPSAHLLAIARP